MDVNNKNDIVYTNKWFSIKRVTLNNKYNEEYFILNRDPGVICLILDEDDQIILVKQKRIPLSKKTIEMPAGAIEKNETPLEAVRREVLEETGYSCKSFHLLTEARLMINRENVIEFFFIGFDAKPMLKYKKIENTEIIKFSRNEFKTYIVSGKFDQTVALGALYEAEQKYGFQILNNTTSEIKNKINLFNNNNKISE